MTDPWRTAAVLAIGDELILGQKTDTNSAWIAARLTALGVRVVEHATVDDDEALIAGSIRRLAGADVVVCTGGLGPTPDDLTRAGLARAMGSGLVRDPELLGMILARYASMGREMPATNAVQADRPGAARGLVNDNGTAPGLHGVIGACDVFCLPGPPREMRPMFEREVEVALASAGGGDVIRTRLIHTLGIGESDLAGRLGAMLDRDREPLVGTTASLGVVTCRIRCAPGTPEAEAQDALDRTEREIRVTLEGGTLIFGAEDRDSSPDPLLAGVMDRLRAREERLVVAESCTGGALGARVTAAAGSSEVFDGGWITYSNNMKRAVLGVSGTTLEDAGAVSGATATEMARGALDRAAGASWAVSITGVAGPGGGSEEKPVGTVWIGIAGADGAVARRFAFRGSREMVRAWSAASALGALLAALDEYVGPLVGERPG